MYKAYHNNVGVVNWRLPFINVNELTEALPVKISHIFTLKDINPKAKVVQGNQKAGTEKEQQKMTQIYIPISEGRDHYK
jgi:hypothetical protein